MAIKSFTTLISQNKTFNKDIKIGHRFSKLKRIIDILVFILNHLQLVKVNRHSKLTTSLLTHYFLTSCMAALSISTDNLVDLLEPLTSQTCSGCTDWNAETELNGRYLSIYCYLIDFILNYLLARNYKFLILFLYTSI